jgi:hypothetical protein
MTALAQQAGMDPTKVRFARDSGGRAMFTDGKKTVDVSAQAMWLAGAKAYEMIEAANTAAQRGMVTQSNLARNDASIRASDASATQSRASANLANTRAKTLTGGGGGGVWDAKAAKDVAAILSKNALMAGSDTAAAAGMALARTHAQRGMPAAEAAKQAGADFERLSATIAAKIKAKDPGVMAYIQKNGLRADPYAVAAHRISTSLGRPTGGSAAAADEED